MNENLRKVIRAIESSGSDCMVVGVAGGSCSGKSTVAAWLVRQLPDARILRVDDYYRSRVVDEEKLAVNFDEPGALDVELLRLHLDQLRGGEGVEKPTYDFRSHSRTGFELFDAAKVMVLDGIFALHESLRDKVDLGVFVTCSAGERRRRRILRDSTERGRSLASIVHQYDTTVRPMHDLHVEDTRAAADLVVANDEPWDEE